MTAPSVAEDTALEIFGIRHHGPGSARSLVAALGVFEPDVVLIEGPADADPLIPLGGVGSDDPAGGPAGLCRRPAEPGGVLAVRGVLPRMAGPDLGGSARRRGRVLRSPRRRDPGRGRRRRGPAAGADGADAADRRASGNPAGPVGAAGRGGRVRRPRALVGRRDRIPPRRRVAVSRSARRHGRTPPRPARSRSRRCQARGPARGVHAADHPIGAQVRPAPGGRGLRRLARPGADPTTAPGHRRRQAAARASPTQGPHHLGAVDPFPARVRERIRRRHRLPGVVQPSVECARSADHPLADEGGRSAAYQGPAGVQRPRDRVGPAGRIAGQPAGSSTRGLDRGPRRHPGRALRRERADARLRHRRTGGRSGPRDGRPGRPDRAFGGRPDPAVPNPADQAGRGPSAARPRPPQADRPSALGVVPSAAPARTALDPSGRQRDPGTRHLPGDLAVPVATRVRGGSDRGRNLGDHGARRRPRRRCST